MKTNVTAENISNAQILDLLAEAMVDGDDVLVHVCGVAIGDEEPISTPEEWEERYGGGGYAPGHMDGCIRFDSVDSCRVECARVICEAQQ